MNAPEPTALASMLTEEILRLLRGDESSERWRKVAGTAGDLQRLAEAREALWRRQERLDAKREALRLAPPLAARQETA